MSKTYMRKEKGDDTIVCVALNEWPRYRASGYVFVEKNKDGDTPQQQFVKQDLAPAERAGKKKAKKKVSKKKT